jgi:tRNA(Ile)-lysidine synthase
VAADLLDRVRDTIGRHGMLVPGDRVLVGVSGGADSTALLYLLTQLAAEWRLALAALHVDHGLRPQSARDAEAVRGLAARLDVPLAVARVEVSRRGSLEEAARKARYAALQAEADRIGAARIAVGHTADDQAETVLMRLLEGASARGLAGIPPVRGRIIRPLLDVRHDELIRAVEEAGLAWIEDPMNRDPRFLRSRVRHQLLPMLTTVGSADTLGGLLRVAAQARAAVDTIERIAAAELRRVGRPEADALVLPREALAALPGAVAAEVLWQAAATLGARGPWRRWAHRGLRRVLATPSPRRPLRLGTVQVEAGSGLVRVARGPAPPLQPRILTVPGRVELTEIGLDLEARIVPSRGYVVPRGPRRVAFDAEAVAGVLHVRGRRDGDRFHPFGAASDGRLKTFLIENDVPRWERDRLPLIEAGDAILWLGGLRRSALAPVTASTERILELVLKPLADRTAGQ